MCAVVDFSTIEWPKASIQQWFIHCFSFVKWYDKGIDLNSLTYTANIGDR